MIAKDGEILTDDQSITQITREDTFEHPTTKKIIDNHLIYKQLVSNSETYMIEFIRKRGIILISVLGKVAPLKASIAKLLGANPSYTRILGEVRLTHDKEGVKTVYLHEGFWGQMFFGNNKNSIINHN